MEKVQSSRIEKLKSILLVVLVLTTILLLYFLWGSKSLEDFIFNDNSEHYDVLSIEKIIIPDQIFLGRGNEDYSVVYSNKEEIWNNQILNTFRNFSKGTNVIVDEITEERYKEVTKYPGIITKFKYDVPFIDFCKKNNIKQLQGYDNINNMTEIGFFKGSKETIFIFIFDKSKKKYYQIIGNGNLEIFDQIDSIISRQETATYCTLKTILGEESNNDTLVPFDSPSIVPIEYQKDIEQAEKENTDAMAQAYFGKTFDFVRKIEESNGKTVYMYGYGQKVLIINPNDGSIEYKEEVKANSSEPKSMFESLDAALDFTGSHGGFKTIEGQQITPYLESVSPIGDKKSSYRFVFSFMLGKNKVFYEEQMPIIIEVVDGQVSYFRKEFINFDENQGEKKSNQDRTSAINMLAMNYGYMKEALTKAGVIDKEQAKNISFEDITYKIDNLYTGYLKPKAKASEDANLNIRENLKLVPVWVVEVKGILLYFDLYDGQPKGYSKVY